MKSIIIFVVSLPLFIFLELGFKVVSVFDLIFPFIFSIVAAISVYKIYRRYLFIISFLLFAFMVVFYLFWQMDLSNWFGSLGIGILTITMLSHIPELMKDKS